MEYEEPDVPSADTHIKRGEIFPLQVTFTLWQVQKNWTLKSQQEKYNLSE